MVAALAQKEWLSRVVQNRGHQIIFYLKHHCELDFIEIIWGYMKAKLKKTCTYNLDALQGQLGDIPINIDGVCEKV